MSSLTLIIRLISVCLCVWCVHANACVDVSFEGTFFRCASPCPFTQYANYVSTSNDKELACASYRRCFLEFVFSGFLLFGARVLLISCIWWFHDKTITLRFIKLLWIPFRHWKWRLCLLSHIAQYLATESQYQVPLDRFGIHKLLHKILSFEHHMYRQRLSLQPIIGE